VENTARLRIDDTDPIPVHNHIDRDGLDTL
jgi:hypothetical protein